jgi:hypothetical protein
MDNFTTENNYKLFDSIEYQNVSDLRNLIDDLSIEQSLFFINKAIDYSYNRGSFSLTESEIISKSLSLLNQKFLSNPIK